MELCTVLVTRTVVSIALRPIFRKSNAVATAINFIGRTKSQTEICWIIFLPSPRQPAQPHFSPRVVISRVGGIRSAEFLIRKYFAICHVNKGVLLPKFVSFGEIAPTGD